MNSKINFPNDYDDDGNPFVVQNALKLLLLHDYYPGQKDIIRGRKQEEIFDKFPETGIITLTDQVSDKTQRSISFFYGSKKGTRRLQT